MENEKEEEKEGKKEEGGEKEKVKTTSLSAVIIHQ